MALGSIMSLISEEQKKDKRRELDRQINNAPKYVINNEAYQNQAIARQQAYGRDEATMIQEQNLDQDAADTIAEARNVTSSSSGLLSTLAAINANKSGGLRDLAAQEARIKQQNKGQLINVNNQMIDEKDKAWNYNVNMPYQNRIAALRDQIKFLSEMSMAGMSYEAQTSSSFMGSMGSMMGGA
jgi:hypothetical protein